MACIYHIYSQLPTGSISNEIYIGQTIVDADPNSFSKRPMAHFSGVYSKTASNRENTMFFEFLEKYPFNSMTVEIYDGNHLFGIDEKVYESFFSEWSIDGMKPNWTFKELNDNTFNITKEQRKLALSLYLDAAEVIHNYVAYHQNRTLLTHQIGGQRTSFRSKNGLVLNSTLDVETACTYIDAAQLGVKDLQDEFDKILNKYLYTIQINNQTLLQALASSAIVAQANKKDYTSEWTIIFARYLKKIIPIIRDDLDKILSANSKIQISNKMTNLYSTIESKFMWNVDRSQKGSFNIINAIIQKLTTESRKRTYKLATLEEDLAKSIEGELKGTIENGISFANFFEITVDKNILSPQKWYIKAPNEIHHALDNDVYGLSFRKRAYWFFANEVAKVWKTNPSYTTPRYVDNFGTRYYIISTYNLSAAIRRQFEKDVKNPHIFMNWEEYLHPMLTLYTQRHGTTLGGVWQDFVFQGTGVNLAIPDLGLVSILSDSISLGVTREGGGGYENQKETEGFLSYQFSQDTLEDIIAWQNQNIIDLTFF